MIVLLTDFHKMLVDISTFSIATSNTLNFYAPLNDIYKYLFSTFLTIKFAD